MLKLPLEGPRQQPLSYFYSCLTCSTAGEQKPPSTNIRSGGKVEGARGTEAKGTQCGKKEICACALPDNLDVCALFCERPCLTSGRKHF
jgi:hypothetical protein